MEYEGVAVIPYMPSSAPVAAGGPGGVPAYPSSPATPAAVSGAGSSGGFNPSWLLSPGVDVYAGLTGQDPSAIYNSLAGGINSLANGTPFVSGGQGGPFTQSNYQQYQANQFNPDAKAFQGYNPFLAKTAQIGTAGQQPFNQAALGLMQQLQAQANGQGPSLAEQQFQAGNQASMGQLMSGLNSQRTPGMNPGMALKTAANQQGANQQNNAMGAAQGRIQEQLAARQQLQNTIGQGQNAAIGLAEQQAALNQGANQFNAGAQNQAGQFNSQSQQALQGLLSNLNQFYNTLGANQQNLQNQFIGQGALQQQQGNIQARNAVLQQIMNMIGGGGNGAGQLMQQAGMGGAGASGAGAAAAAG